MKPTPEEVKAEIRERLNGMNKSPEEMREQLVRELRDTYWEAERELVEYLCSSPVHGLKFVTYVSQTLGMVNEVAFNEFNLIPIHLSELNTVTVSTLEATADMVIDDILKRVGATI